MFLRGSQRSIPVKTLLTVGEVAELLRIKPQTLYKWICERKIPSISLGGRTLFDKDELQAWISSKKRDQVKSI